MEACNQFDLDRIRAEAPVASLEWHAELPSTNDRALQLAQSASNEELPKLILAERQVAGRGRGSNRWYASEGALTFSLLLDTSAMDLPPARWPLASLTTGLAICETLDQLAPAAWAGLKWPNDVYLRERKVCGILIEGPPGKSERLVVGVGINANNRLAEAPADVQLRATSLADATRLTFELTELLLRVLQRLDARWKQLATTDMDLPAAWQQWCLLTGRVVQVAANDRVFTGYCSGIGPDGALLLQTEEGETRLFGGAVVSWS